MLKSVDNIYKLYIDHINDDIKQQAERINLFDIRLTEELKGLNQIFKKKMAEQKLKLLTKIAEDNNLNFDHIKMKYLKPKELKILELNNNDNNDMSDNNDNVLDKIEINGTVYYCDTTKDKGIVYNTNSKQVGFITNGKVTLI